MVHIETQPAPDLKPTKMLCDDVIDKKLLKYPMLAEAFSTPSFNVILGKMGQGKTSLITSFVNNREIFKKTFEHIYVFIPSNSRASLKNDIYEKYLPGDQLFEELTEENLGAVYDSLKENSAEDEYSLLIIDDLQSDMKNPRVVRMLSRIITKMRHLRTTIFLLQQNWLALEKRLRNLASNVLFFNVGRQQLDDLFLEAAQISKDNYEKVVDLCFKEPHDWVLINLHRHRGIYSNFHKVVLDEEEKK